MCQLLGMSCNTPTDIVFSFEGFRCRGGLTDVHKDGFGIAFFEQSGLRLFHDDNPCANSPVADLIRHYPIKSKHVISHIRKATQGQVSLVNTHPFVRELWGEYWVFAHNGHLRRLPENTDDVFYQEVGTTDSEYSFCLLLNELRHRFDTKPDDETLFNAIREITQNLSEYGMFNFLLSNGKWLIAHCSTLLHYIIRKAPFGEAQLLDDEVKVNFSHVTSPDDCVAIIATLPLTHNETWSQLACGEIVMFREGQIYLRHTPDNPRYLTKEEGLAIARRVGSV